VEVGKKEPLKETLESAFFRNIIPRILRKIPQENI